MRSLGLRNYKQQPEEALTRLLTHLKDAAITLKLEPRLAQLCMTYSSGGAKQRDPDLSDALVALGLVILQREGQARPQVPTATRTPDGGWKVSAEVAAAVAAEGVIWAL